MLLSEHLRCVPYRIPLQGPFRGLEHREGVLISGPAGWGEFAPFADYDAVRDAYWLAAAVEMMVGAVPTAVRDVVGVNAILPEVPVRQMRSVAERILVLSGCRTVKMKVGGGDPALDLELVGVVRSVLDDLLGRNRGAIRLDANGRWTLAQALDLLPRLAGMGIEYVEQPCATVADLVLLRQADPGVAIAADETLRRDRRFTAVGEFADIAVLKVAPLGGGAAVVDLAAGLDVPVVISSALETSIGLARDVRVAAALPDVGLDCGLATGLLLQRDATSPQVLPRAGSITVGSVGAVEPDPDDLAAIAHPDPGAWLDRLDRAWTTAQEMALLPPEHLEQLGATHA